MKLRNIFTYLALTFALSLGLSAQAQVAFKGKKSGASKSFTGKANGETKIGIRAVGKLPKLDYDFVGTVDPEYTDLVTITGATLDFGKNKKANLLATLTEAGLAELEAQGELAVPFTVDFDGENDPGFNQLPGTISYLQSVGQGQGGLKEAAIILFGLEGDYDCPVGELVDSNGNVQFSLLQDIRPTLSGTVKTNADFLDGLAGSFLKTDKKFLTNDERAAIAVNQLESASIAMTAAKKFKKYSSLKFDQGSGAGNFSLENVVATVADADENGDVTISFTADIPATVNIKKKAITAFISDKETAKAFSNGEAVDTADVDLEQEISIKAAFKFKKAKGSIFEANKAQKFDIVFTSGGN